MEQLFVAPGGVTKGGLAPFDHVHAVNGRPVTAGHELQAEVRRHPPGTEIRYLVSRRGRMLELSIPSRATTNQDFKRYVLDALFPSLLYLMLAAVVLALRPGARETRVFLFFCLTWFCTAGLFVDSWITYRFSPLFLTAWAFAPAAYLHIALRFPSTRPVVRRWPWLIGACYVLSGLFALGIQIPAARISFVIPALAAGYWASALVLLVLGLVHSAVKGETPLIRQRAKVLAGGFMVGPLVPVVGTAAETVTGVTVPYLEQLWRLNFLFPLAVAYAMIRYDLFDIRSLIRTSTVYAVVTGLVVAAYAGAIAVVDIGLASLGMGSSRLLPALVMALAVVLFLNPVYRRTQAAGGPALLPGAPRRPAHHRAGVRLHDHPPRPQPHRARHQRDGGPAPPPPGPRPPHPRRGRGRVPAHGSRSRGIPRRARGGCAGAAARAPPGAAHARAAHRGPRPALGPRRLPRHLRGSRRRPRGAGDLPSARHRAPVPGTAAPAGPPTPPRTSASRASSSTRARWPSRTPRPIPRWRSRIPTCQSALRRVQILESIRANLNKFVPRTVQDLIEQAPEAPLLEKREVDVTVLFVDIAGYTRLSERFDLARVNELVERYFGAFLDEILRHGGDVNETAGDGLMVIFRGEDPRAHARAAVLAAQGVLRRAHAINGEIAELTEPIRLHVGVEFRDGRGGRHQDRGHRGHPLDLYRLGPRDQSRRPPRRARRGRRRHRGQRDGAAAGRRDRHAGPGRAAPQERRGAGARVRSCRRETAPRRERRGPARPASTRRARSREGAEEQGGARHPGGAEALAERRPRPAWSR